MRNFNQGPIIYVEDDIDDRGLFGEVLKSLEVSNEILYFENGKLFLNYITQAKVQPLLIVCDINMPVMNGLELRKAIMADERLRKKAIPFIFYTTSINTHEINLAYDLTVQGYFKKSADLTKMSSDLKMIIDYWCVCQHPNKS